MPACILIADDDPLLVKLVEHKLTLRGYRVTSAPDGETALRLVAEAKPDLIVLDAMMPGLDGFEILRRLKQNAVTTSIPVMMLTARKQEKDVVTALNLGVRDYLIKPFLPEELVLRIGKILGEASPPA